MDTEFRKEKCIAVPGKYKWDSDKTVPAMTELPICRTIALALEWITN